MAIGVGLSKILLTQFYWLILLLFFDINGPTLLK